MDRHALVAHLARVLPKWSDRESAARSAGLTEVQLAGDPAGVWAHLVEEAEAQGRTEALMRAAWSLRPRDRVLAAAAGEEGAPLLRGSSTGMWGSLVLLMVVAGTARLMATPEAAPEVEPVPAATPAPPPAALPAEPLPPPPNPLGRQAPAGEEQPPSAEELGRLAAVPDVARAEAPPRPPRPPPAPAEAKVVDPKAEAKAADPKAADPKATPTTTAEARKGRKDPCNGGRGYAYVTDGRAPRMGEVWSVPRSINVRADYPRADNGWNSRADVTCVLPPGAKVQIAERPVPVEGGAVWVPVRDAWTE
jgi:outer membrane biosynthesis protein TonB